MPDENDQKAIGSHILQVAGDLNITVQAPSPKRTKASQKLTQNQRAEISRLVEEIESAEQGRVKQAFIRYSLNNALKVTSIEEVTDDQFSFARTYLSGWKSCALGEHQIASAMIAQFMRIRTIVPALQAVIAKFSRDHFGTSKLTDINYWQLRCTLAYAMSLWVQHWEKQIKREIKKESWHAVF